MKIDTREVDTNYKPFPPFKDWLSTQVDTGRWDKYSSKIRNISDQASNTLKRALKIVQRVAAVETGAIEDLYEVDRGFTLTVAMESAMWEAALSEKGDETELLIKSQLEGYDYILDFATGAEPIAQAWIRQLHQKICSGQSTYLVQTAAGPQKQSLPLGKYKTFPNHVIDEDGEVHAYSPVDLTTSEIQRLINEFGTDEFISAHYGLVCIHPFADGNGRVARALASVFTYKGESIPFLIQADDRKEYFNTLSEADKGNFQPFVDFTIDRCLDAMNLVVQSILAANTNPASNKLTKIAEFYRTKDGYSYDEVDSAGRKLMTLLEEEFKSQLIPISEIENIDTTRVGKSNTTYAIRKEDYRLYTNAQGEQLNITISSKSPTKVSTNKLFLIEIPKDCGSSDDFSIVYRSGEEVFTARMNELHPDARSSLVFRIQIFCETQINELAEELYQKMEEASRSNL